MKIFLCTALIIATLFGEYEKGKIDMHGGKEDYTYEKKEFEKSKGSFGVRGMFLDQNSSKNTPKNN